MNAARIATVEQMPVIIWSDYLKYRAALRGFDVATLEHIIRHSSERYLDTETGRSVIVGRHESQLVMIPCEIEGGSHRAGNCPRHQTSADSVPAANREVHP